VSTFKLSPESVWKDMPGIDWLTSSLLEHGYNMMNPGIFLIPRNIIEKAGGWNEELSLIDDFEFMSRIIAASSFVLFCEDAILMYRSGLTASLSSQLSRKHLLSALKSVQLGTQTILNTKN